MTLPFNTKLPTDRSTIFTNDVDKVIKIDKIFIVNKLGVNVNFTVWVVNNRRAAELTPANGEIPIGGCYELSGPIYLDKEDKLEGDCSHTDAISISIQGEP